jgi:hypothetical protein
LGITDAGSGGRVGTLTNDYFYFVTNNTERLRINTSGHLIAPQGITLGTSVGTYAAANTLDDYEEGTFVPTLSYVTAGTASFGYSAQTAHYVKVGDIVHFQLNIRLNAFTKGSA